MYRITVKLDDGRFFDSEVETPEEVQQHATEIIKNGYIDKRSRIIIHYPVHRISYITYAKIDLKLPIEKAN